MSFLHYFSKDANKRTKFIFDAIAPLYGMGDGILQKSYNQSIELLKNEIELKNRTVLDFGTGTGAWGAMFLRNQAANVLGVDISPEMIKQSRKKHQGIKFIKGNIEKIPEIESNSFDIVTASYVIHGVKTERRMKIISEMHRISKGHVIIHDFLGHTALPVRLLEWMERSDYKNFKLNIVKELKTRFSDVKIIPTGDGSGLYLASGKFN